MPNSCGYIAAEAALQLHKSNDWFAEDILNRVANVNLIKKYNKTLGYQDVLGHFLNDDQILHILHSETNSPAGVNWLDSIPPFNYFLKTLQNHLKQNLPRNKRLHIAIVNTTSQFGPLNNAISGDHWITVAYELA